MAFRRIVLGHLVRPDVHDQVGLDDVDDLLSDRCGIVAGYQLIAFGLQLTVQDPEERLRILIAPDAFRNTRPRSLRATLPRGPRRCSGIRVRTAASRGRRGWFFEQLGEPFVERRVLIHLLGDRPPGRAGDAIHFCRSRPCRLQGPSWCMPEATIIRSTSSAIYGTATARRSRAFRSLGCGRDRRRFGHRR